MLGRLEPASDLDSNNAEHFNVLGVPVSGFLNQEALQLAFVSSFTWWRKQNLDFKML